MDEKKKNQEDSADSECSNYRDKYAELFYSSLTSEELDE